MAIWKKSSPNIILFESWARVTSCKAWPNAITIDFWLEVCPHSDPAMNYLRRYTLHVCCYVKICWYEVEQKKPLSWTY